MTSRLSSLLVRDGIVTVKRMERAFQRQVMTGGGLDTVLLELGLVPEARLIQYLALASGLPPATAADFAALDVGAAVRCTREIAEQRQAVPLYRDGDALRVLTRDPVDVHGLEELADQLGLPIQPLVAPEYRFRVVFRRVYGGSLHARFAALARQLDAVGLPDTPVGRSRTVVVDSSPPPAAEPEPAARPTRPISVDAMRAHRDQIEQQGAQRAATAGLAAEAPAPPSVAGSDGGTPPGPTVAGAADVAGAAPATSEPPASAPAPERSGADDEPEIRVDRDEPAALPRRRAGRPSSTVEITARAATEPGEQLAADVTPLALGPARSALEAAEQRDEVFELLLRAVRSHTYYAGLLTVQGHVAVGRLAIIGDQPDRAAIESVLIPLDTPSAFRKAADSGAPYIGPLATGDPPVDAMIRRMGGVMPPAALVMPIALRGRVVALVVAHRGADTLSITEMSELLPLAAAAADALSRIIRGRKSSTASDGPSPRPDSGGPTEVARATSSPVPQPIVDESSAVHHATPPAAAASPHRPAELVDPVTLLDQVEASDPTRRDAARRAALELPDGLVEEVGQRFPGHLDVEREPGIRRHAAEHGPLLELVVGLGPAATPLLETALTSSDASSRYYAALCAIEIDPRRFAGALVSRLFDPDEDIRRLVGDELGKRPAGDLAGHLDGLRQAIGDPDPGRARMAAEACAALGDIGAIPALLTAQGRGPGPGAAAATAALVQLTRQDFGDSNKKWRQWWSRNRERHRIEWMLEGLAHKDPAIRRAAIDDLRRLTGEYFGYHHDLAKRERESARQRWVLWWHETGRRRFLRQAGADRQSPTASP